MIRAMEERDVELAGKELGVDARYKARGADIDNKTMVLQLGGLRSLGTSACQDGSWWELKNNLVPLVLLLTLSPFPRGTRFLLSRQ